MKASDHTQRIRAVLFPDGIEKTICVPGPCFDEKTEKLIFTSGPDKHSVDIHTIAYVELLSAFTIIRLKDNTVHCTHCTQKTSNAIQPMIYKNEDLIHVNDSFFVDKKFVNNWNDHVVHIKFNTIQKIVLRDPELILHFQRQMRTA